MGILSLYEIDVSDDFMRELPPASEKQLEGYFH